VPPIVSPLQKVFQAIQRLAKGTDLAEPAIERARSLPEYIDPSRYSPPALARATLQMPAAQKGFAESLVSQRPPFASTLVRPSEWAEHTPPLDSVHDANIIEYLRNSLSKDKLKELPVLWADQYPHGLDLGYEGRHRMEALRQLYGDDPVLTNLIKGDRFDIVNSPYYKDPVREYRGDINMSPLELLRQQMQFGDKPFKVDPLWMSDK